MQELEPSSVSEAHSLSRKPSEVPPAVVKVPPCLRSVVWKGAHEGVSVLVVCCCVTTLPQTQWL